MQPRARCARAGVLTETTAELAAALTLAAARRVVEADVFMRAGHYKGWLPTLFVGQLLQVGLCEAAARRVQCGRWSVKPLTWAHCGRVPPALPTRRRGFSEGRGLLPSRAPPPCLRVWCRRTRRWASSVRAASARRTRA